MNDPDSLNVKQKSFIYKTSLVWTGKKNCTLSSEEKPEIRVSSPLEFNGEPGNWTPEDFFVASVETCHMATFLSFAEKAGMKLNGYKSHANGILEYLDGDFRFTRIVLFPTIVVGKLVNEQDVYTLLDKAHKHCLVANSIASIVEVNPTVVRE